MLINTQTQNIQTPKSPVFKGMILSERPAVPYNTTNSMDIQAVENLFDMMEVIQKLARQKDSGYSIDTQAIPMDGEYTLSLAITENPKDHLFFVTVKPRSNGVGQDIYIYEKLDPQDKHRGLTIDTTDLPAELQEKVKTQITEVIYQIANPEATNMFKTQLSNLKMLAGKLSEKISIGNGGK